MLDSAQPWEEQLPAKFLGEDDACGLAVYPADDAFEWAQPIEGQLHRIGDAKVPCLHADAPLGDVPRTKMLDFAAAMCANGVAQFDAGKAASLGGRAREIAG